MRQTILDLRNSRDRLAEDLGAARALIDIRTEEVMEANHRVKNSIQTAMSILNIQADIYAGDDRGREVAATLNEASRRLAHIARAHELLHDTGVDRQSIEMDAYLSGICAALAAAHADRPIELIFEVEPLTLEVQRAVSLTLILVEAVTNAYKHGFPAGRPGTIRVAFGAFDGRSRLSIADDGIGFAAPEHEHSSGMRIMRGFSHNAGADIVIDGTAGTRVTVTL